MTGFVRGKPLHAEQEEEDEEAEAGGRDEDEEEEDEGRTRLAARRRHPTMPTTTKGECPSALYAELTARPPAEPEVTVVEDDEVQIVATKRRRRDKTTPAPRGGGSEVIIDLVDDDDDDDEKKEAQVFDCAVCQERITSMGKATHERSTLHTFNAKKAVSGRRIMLPESNRGVQLLTRMGWKEEEGLGKDGQGLVQPAKSTLKLDRKGLGHKQQLPARVTHFPSHDAEQAARAPDGKSDAQRKVEEVERLVKEARAHARGDEGPATYGAVDHYETAKERERRMKKEKETRTRIQAELNREEDVPLPPGYSHRYVFGDGIKGKKAVTGTAYLQQQGRAWKKAGDGGPSALALAVAADTEEGGEAVARRPPGIWPSAGEEEEED